MPETAPEAAKGVCLARGAEKGGLPVGGVVEAEDDGEEYAEGVVGTIESEVGGPDPVDCAEGADCRLSVCYGAVGGG